MSQTEGLVKRRNVAVKENSDGSFNPREAEDDDKIVDCNEDDDGDSKDTRLTLMEEVLLLGLKDKEVLTLNLNTYKNPRRFALLWVPYLFYRSSRM